MAKTLTEALIQRRKENIIRGLYEEASISDNNLSEELTVSEATVIKDGSDRKYLKVDISGKTYHYLAKDDNYEELARKVNKIRTFSAGKAVQYLKQNAILWGSDKPNKQQYISDEYREFLSGVLYDLLGDNSITAEDVINGKISIKSKTVKTDEVIDCEFFGRARDDEGALGQFIKALVELEVCTVNGYGELLSKTAKNSVHSEVKKYLYNLTDKHNSQVKTTPNKPSELEKLILKNPEKILSEPTSKGSLYISVYDKAGKKPIDLKQITKKASAGKTEKVLKEYFKKLASKECVKNPDKFEDELYASNTDDFFSFYNYRIFNGIYLQDS